MAVNPKRKADWERRLECLRRTIQEIIDHKHEEIQVPECVVHEERFKYVIPIELFYDDVNAKWPDAARQREAARKRNAEVTGIAGDAGPSDAEDVQPPAKRVKQWAQPTIMDALKAA